MLDLKCCSLCVRNMERRENEKRVLNAFETWSLRGMLNRKWTDRITNDEVFQRRKKKNCFKRSYAIDTTHCYGMQLGITSLQ